MPLLPLARFGPVCRVSSAGQLQEQAGEPSVQIYARGGRDRLSYTPLGRDGAHLMAFDVAAFRALFQL